MAKKALLGANDSTVGKVWEKVCGLRGYEVEYAQTPEEMLEKINYFEGHRYRCIMDVNLGSGLDIWPGRGAWNLVDALAKDGEDIKIMTISGDDRVVEAAKKEGIPITRKTDFSVLKIMEFLGE